MWGQRNTYTHEGRAMDDMTESAEDIIATVTSGVQKARTRRAALASEIAKLDKALATISDIPSPKAAPVERPMAPQPHRVPAKAKAKAKAPKAHPKAEAASLAPPDDTKGKPGRKPSSESRTSRALAFVSKRKDASTAEIAAHLGINNIAASQVVNQLKHQNRLSSRGERGALRHYAANGASATA